MQPWRRLLRVTLAFWILAGPTQRAAAAEAPDGKPWDTPRVLRMMQAGRRTVYAGVQRIEMSHGPRTTETTARVAQLEGWTRTEFLSPDRMRGMVVLERGGQRLVRLSGRRKWSQRPGSEPSRSRLLARNYRLTETGRAQVAGRPVVVVDIQHRQLRKTARRLWMDVETGVALRTELRDWTGKVVGTTELGEIDYTPQLEKSAFVVPPGDIVRHPPVEPPPGAETIPLHPAFLPPGYVPAGPHRWVRMDRGTAAHLRFTDGLKAISLFVRRLNPDEKPLPERDPQREGRRPSFSGVVRVTKGDCRITAMGDAPPGILAQIAESLE
ncbi:MAG: MucB/RseB C-terminal domain-containing protein [Armatimonadetes bacterium]|nr:MucB/RseB C-terminal domain-containing protein [Armatimonadota bacterium]